MEDGLTIVLTPIQLAAVLSGGTLPGPASDWNRAWGGAKLIFGALEELGAAGLLLAPEPTTLTKIGGVALGAHGADTMQSGGRQLWTGRDTQTLASDGTAALAQVLGVSEESARRIGEGVDMAIPIALSFGLGAVRLIGVRSGRIVLAEHEALAGSRVGGHTILKHVGQTDAQLVARLATSRASAISTFNTIAEAETGVTSVMRVQRAQILAWARTTTLTPRQSFVGPAVAGGVGRVLVRGASSPVAGRAVRVVLKKEAYNGKLVYVLTAFPIV